MTEPRIDEGMAALHRDVSVAEGESLLETHDLTVKFGGLTALDAVSFAIKRGENAGKKIRYFNVVREMSPVGMWHGKEVSIELSQRDLASRGHDGGAVLLQAGPSGPIIGAVALSGL